MVHGALRTCEPPNEPSDADRDLKDRGGVSASQRMFPRSLFEHRVGRCALARGEVIFWRASESLISLCTL